MRRNAAETDLIEVGQECDSENHRLKEREVRRHLGTGGLRGWEPCSQEQILRQLYRRCDYSNLEIVVL